MRVSRVGAKSCFLDGNIYVIGGCRKSEEESMNCGEVFDLKTQTWNPLPSPSDNYAVHSNHKVAVFGERLYVITKRNNYAYDPNEGRWLPDVGSVDLQPITGPWSGGIEKYTWYSSSHRAWQRVMGLDVLYDKRGCGYRTIQLVNYGGKLLIIWSEWIMILDGYSLIRSQEKEIWCAVIRLEERMSYFGPQIWGEVESCNVVVPSVPKSYQLSSCQCVSV
ncbi:putative F-box/kelch-repeat protein [Arabidopsis thaliana]